MNRWMKLVLHKRWMVFFLLLLVAILGVEAYRNLRIDVFPDPSPVMVQLHCEADGMAPEEVETYVTRPVERALVGLPGVERITSLSTFGLSTVNAYFADGTNIYLARQLVSQQLPAVRSSLPGFVAAPELGPITTALGMVYVYALEGPQSPMELRSLQDWVVRFQLQTVPGVAAVLSHGGDVRQFQVVVDPGALVKYGVELAELVARIKESSRNITAGYIVKNREEYIVRGLGLLSGVKDLQSVTVREKGSTPVTLADLAQVQVGPAVKRGEAIFNDDGSTVAGIVMKLAGVNTAELIERLDRRIHEVNAGLPEGIRVVPVYNQALIIRAAFATVAEALLLGVLLVAMILFLFVNDLSAAAVSTLAIPFAGFVTFVFMRVTGMTADLMSFGGLAIGIGLLVDGTVVVVENITRLRNETRGEADGTVVTRALSQILRPLVYALLVMAAAFLPILSLRGVEGKLFRPFGITLLVAMLAAGLYALFVAPGLMHALGPRPMRGAGWMFSKLERAYMRLFDAAYARPKATVIVFVLLFVAGVTGMLTRGSEFIPTLSERSLQMEITLPRSTALEETTRVMRNIHSGIREMPGVVSVFGRIGRGESGTHAHPVHTGNSIINLDPELRWTGAARSRLTSDIRRMVRKRAPGVQLNFTQPIQHNLDFLLTGVRADLAVKVYGNDYRRLTQVARRIKGIMSDIEGIEDLQVVRTAGQHEYRIRVDRGRLARYGLEVGTVLTHVEMAVGGRSVARIYQGEQVTEVFVRFAADARRRPADLEHIRVPAANGAIIPLSAVARLDEATGFGRISRENNRRYVTVQCNIHGRSIGDVVSEAQRRVYATADLPVGVFLGWGGQYELKEKAEKRLLVALSLALLILFVLLFDFLGRSRDLLLVLVNLPVSLSGGMLALWISGAWLSVPSTIGFLVLLGIALENTLILTAFLRRKTRTARDIHNAIRDSVSLRLRPILMTKFTTMIGLVPLLFSAGIGAEVQRPLVVVVMGGIFFSIFTTLLLLPITWRMAHSGEQITLE